jgi:hypothetical protein
MRRFWALIPCLLWAGLLAALLVPAWIRSHRIARVTSFTSNLCILWKIQNNYAVQFGGPAKRLPEETGDEFWRKLSSPRTLLIDPSLADVYQCPLEGTPEEGCDYRGPTWDVNDYGDGDPVGADVEGNHGDDEGGNVVRKSGDVMTVGTRDELWARSAERLSGGDPPRPRMPREIRRWGMIAAAGMLLLLLVVKAIQAARGVATPNRGFAMAVIGLLGCLAALSAFVR